MALTYMPDVGEVVEARRGRTDRFVQARVMRVEVTPRGWLRVRLVWQGGDPQAGWRGRGGQSRYRGGAPVVAGQVGWVQVPPGRWPCLVRPCSAPYEGTEQGAGVG